MRSVVHLDIFAAGKDLVTALIFVPLSDGRILVHVLDDVAPADAGVICTEADLAFLCAIGDDAHFGAAAVAGLSQHWRLYNARHLVEEVLKPHSGDKQEIPRILTAFLDVLGGAGSVFVRLGRQICNIYSSKYS